MALLSSKAREEVIDWDKIVSLRIKVLLRPFIKHNDYSENSCLYGSYTNLPQNQDTIRLLPWDIKSPEILSLLAITLGAIRTNHFVSDLLDVNFTDYP